RYAADTGEVALLHRGAVLTVEIVAGSHAVEITADIEAPLQDIELAPRIDIDAWFVGTIPGNEIKDRVVVILRSEQRRDVVHIVGRDQCGERRDIYGRADVVVRCLVHDRSPDGSVAESIARALNLETRGLIR